MSFILYNASAGSGKTYTLVRDYLMIALKEPTAYGAILAVTFTNKAAGEMKERIIATLSNLTRQPVTDKTLPLQRELCAHLTISAAELTAKAQTVLTAILHGYSDFAVSTIDSFIMKIIRTFSRELGLPLRFEIDMMPKALLSKTIDMLLSRAGTAGSEDITTVITTFIEQQIEEEAGWDITPVIHRSGMSLFEDDAFQRNIHFSVDDVRKLWAIVNKFRGDMKEYGHAFSGLYEDHGLQTVDFSYGDSGIAGYFNKIQNDDAILSFKPGKRVDPDEGKEVPWIKKDSSIKGRFEEIFEALDAIRIQTIGYYQAHAPLALGAEALLNHIYGGMLLNYLASEMEQYKKQNQIIPISDFGQLVHEIVKDNPVPFIYMRIGERYSHIFIDEFQDTSNRQWENFLPLISECISKNGTGLAVGDGKQAIYRFRGGDVSLIRRDAAQTIRAGSGQDVHKKNLESNFRSAPAVVDFNNAFFNAACVKTPVAHAELQDIYKALSQQTTNINPGYVQIDAWDTNEIVTAALAYHISTLREKNFNYGDIAILVRNNKTGAAITEFLFSEGIPVVSPEFLLLAREPSVLFVINAMRYAFDPGNGAALMQMLHFYLPKISAHATKLLADIADRSANDRRITPEPLKDILSELYNNISELHHIKNMPVYEAAEMIIRRFRLQTIENGAYQGYLASLLNHMLGFIQDSCADSAGFLRWWDENKESLYMPVTEGIDAVSVLTVHKSKGAEYPAVIVAESWMLGFEKTPQIWVKADKALNGNDGDSLIALSKGIEESVFSDDYAAELKKSYLDNLNLLYVAFTRAMRVLIVLTDRKDHKEAVEKGVIEKTSHLITACCKDIPSTAPITDHAKFAYGEMKPFHSDSTADTLIRPQFITKEWRSRVSIRRRAHQLWRLEEGEQAERVNHGIILHDILSRVGTIDDVADAVRFAVYEGKLEEADFEPYRLKITDLITGNDDIRRWFSTKSETERDIAFNGAIFRPDRVVFQGDRVVVIDYKTGMYETVKHTGYTKQVQTYMEALKAAGYTEISGHIWYIEDRPAEPFAVTEGA